MKAQIFVIKVLHSLLFFFIFCMVYIAYAGLTRTYNFWLIFSVCSLSIEAFILWINGWHCPLTRLAENRGAENGSVTDIFLPPIIARNAFKISFSLAAIEMAFLAARYFVV